MINKNLKFLRSRDGLTQKQFAEKLGLKQSAIGAYEEERATPPLSCLLDISDQYKISLDVLTRKDLSKVPEQAWKDQQFSRGKEILAITVNEADEENVELVSHKASAGYLNGFQDPEYVEKLPKVVLPMLPRHATYRAFEIRGDSMLPVPPGAVIFGEYVDQLTAVKSGGLYILVTRGEGIVFKRVFNRLEEERQFLLVSDNRQYDPYVLRVDEVCEVWKAKGYFTTEFSSVERLGDIVLVEHLALKILTLQEELQRLKKK